MIFSNWNPLRNVFNNATKGTFKRMLIMSTDHHDKLLAESGNDPQLLTLYQLFLPAYLQFKKAYNETFQQDAFYQGNTQIVETLFGELSSQKIRQWDIWIQNVYLDNTPQYLMLLPSGRSPFQRGSYEARINAIVALEANLGSFVNLANVLSDVSAFRQQIEQARTQQQGLEKAVANTVKAVEEARVELAQVMQGILGGLILHYYKNIVQVETFYELKYLRSTSEGGGNTSLSLQSHNIGASSRATLYGQLAAGNAMTLRNTGTVAIHCFTSNDVNGNPAIDSLVLQPNEEQTVFADELSNGNGFSWLILVNNDATITGKCEVGKG
ncbi:MAG: hypothetical protein ACRCSB_06165 [Bacteroidales bacterium]